MIKTIKTFFALPYESKYLTKTFIKLDIDLKRLKYMTPYECINLRHFTDEQINKYGLDIIIKLYYLGIEPHLLKEINFKNKNTIAQSVVHLYKKVFGNKMMSYKEILNHL